MAITFNRTSTTTLNIETIRDATPIILFDIQECKTGIFITSIQSSGQHVKFDLPFLSKKRCFEILKECLNTSIISQEDYLTLSVYFNSVKILVDYFGGFQKVVMPLMRTAYPKSISQELFSCQPLTAPAGISFSFDLEYNKSPKGNHAQNHRNKD